MIQGPKVVNRSYTLSEIPVFSRTGTIVPMRTDGYNNGDIISISKFFKIFRSPPDPLGTATGSPSSIKLMVFVGDALTYV